MNDEELPVILTSSSAKVTQGMITVQHRTFSQKVSKAVMFGIGGTIISAVLVAIPLLHFILVPIGLLVTGSLVIKALNQNSFIGGGTVQCPYCSEPIMMVKRAFSFPYYETCGSCSQQSKVTLLSPQP